MRALLLATLLVLPVVASAETVPAPGSADPRVRVVTYNPADVVRLATFYGVSTHIQFAGNESITSVAVGDPEAWEVVARGSHLFVKPRAVHADSNVTVLTDRRVYQFALVVEPRQLKDPTAWRDPNLIYSLSFKYPDDEAAAAAAAAKEAAAKAKEADVKSRLAPARSRIDNTDYWVAGAESVSPTAARDDGRFVRLQFAGNRDMPAVYTVDDAGNESLVNVSVEGNEIVVQRMSRKFVLRNGEAVACVVNKAFDPVGGRDNTTGTIAPQVERTIKGGQ